MGRKRKSQRDDSSSSDGSSCDDEMSPVRRTSESHAATENGRSTRRRREDKWIKRMLKELKEDTSEMRKQIKTLTEINNDTREICKQVKKLTETQNELRKYLVDHINGSSGDDSAAPRSEPNQVQPPRYRLKFTCEVNDEIEKGKIIETKNHGKMVTVELLDDHNQIVKTEPLASATVMLVVVNGEFNQHGNQYSWLRKDFERYIKRPRQANSVMADVNQPIESIVTNCVFKLERGAKSHTGATVLYNSSNKKVRLGVMLLSPAEERVLEGLSNPFFVRGHDRPTRQSNPHNNGSKRQKQAPVPYDCQDRSDRMLNMENPSGSILTQPGQINRNVSCLFLGTDPVAAANTNIVDATESSIIPEQASTRQDQFPYPMTMYEANMAQATNGLPDAGEIPLQHDGYSWDPNTQHNYSMGNSYFPLPANGTHFDMDQIARPVQLVWDRPIMGPKKCWDFFDQLMPLYSCSTTFKNTGLHTVHLMTEHLGLLTSTLKDVMHTTPRKKGVLIERLEPDNPNEQCVPSISKTEQLPLKGKNLHTKYRLQFVNKVCEAYYTWEKIKASDSDLLKVALFDENNMRVKSGPLSSASVEVVVLHGDFNVDSQHYWTSEEFSASIMSSSGGKEEPVLGGNRVLTLADGEACLVDAYFQINSCYARTGKFKMGVVVASAHDERIQEGISEPFRVRERHPKVLPPGFRFQPTDKELILHYLENPNAAMSYPIHVIAEVEIYNFNPWELPAGRAVYGDREWYFFSPWEPSCIYRAAGSGYWKATGTDETITTDRNGCELGIKTAFVFYMGHVPRGTKTNWIMDVYRLICDRSTTESNKDSRTSSNMQVDKYVLCKIYNQQLKQQLSTTSMDDDDVSQLVQYNSHSDLPPGFRFLPTDHELILHYLRKRATSLPFPVPIGDVDIYQLDPRDLPACKAVYGDGKKYYFFGPRDRKFPNGSFRPNRPTYSGYWKVTGTDKLIRDTVTGEIIGIKKALVFYRGRASAANKTSWTMLEYRLRNRLEARVLCIVQKRVP